MEEINVFLAFAAGFLSFISPCVLPLYPVFLSYITGMSMDEINQDNKRLDRKAILHTACFLIGFSSIFVMIGFTTTYVSEFLMTYRGYHQTDWRNFNYLFRLGHCGCIEFRISYEGS